MLDKQNLGFLEKERLLLFLQKDSTAVKQYFSRLAQNACSLVQSDHSWFANSLSEPVEALVLVGPAYSR